MVSDHRLLRDFLADGEVFHIARCRVSRENTTAHTHDFAEIFWVESGTSLHHSGAHAQRVGPGDIVLVRPTDLHWYEPSTDLRFVNLAFPADELGFLRGRYFPETPDFYGTSRPEPLVLSHGPLARWVGYQTGRLLRSRRTRRELDLFLIEFFSLLYGSDGAAARPPLPDWYDTLIDLLAEPTTLRGSVASLADSLGLSAEHLARELRRRVGTTPIELLTRARIDYARGLLEHSHMPILDLALECGYGSLSHFYRVFRERVGTTPRCYRERAWRKGEMLAL